MRRELFTILSAVLFFTTWGYFHVTLGEPALPPSPLSAFRERYLDGLFHAKPHLGSYMGDHRFDGQLPDFSESALSKRKDELTAQQKELDGLRKGTLSLDDQIDGEILSDGIRLELLYLTDIKDWETDPRLYDSFPYYDPRELVAERLSDLIHGKSSDQNVAAVTHLLSSIPTLLDQYRHNLKNPSGLYTDYAIKDNHGRIDLVKGEVGTYIQGIADSKAKPRASGAQTQALAALEAYQTFLEKDLKPRSTGDWRLGAERYLKKFPLALSTDLTPDQAVTRAQADFAQSRHELFALATKLHRQMFPGEPVPKEDAPSSEQGAIIHRVKEEIGKDHPKAADLVASHAAGIDKMRAFIIQHDLIRLPPADSLLVLPTPEFKRGVAAAEYLSPNMLDETAVFKGTYSVDPIDPTWPAAKVEQYLTSNGTAANELTATHEAYPGHHVQAWYSKQHLNRLRVALWNAPMAEGWAVYGQDLMVNLGFGGDKIDDYRFLTVQGHLIVAANLVLDAQLHTGKMTDDEALKLLVDGCFYDQTGAAKKLIRAKLDTTQLAQYFLGYSEIRELERDYRKKMGAAFTQKNFNENLVGHGTVGVKYLRRYLLTAQ